MLRLLGVSPLSQAVIEIAAVRSNHRHSISGSGSGSGVELFAEQQLPEVISESVKKWTVSLFLK